MAKELLARAREDEAPGEPINGGSAGASPCQRSADAVHPNRKCLLERDGTQTLVPAGFAERLLAWYREHRRHLPWRQPQRDPYAVWVSEIMLQQTQVSTVVPYFERWMVRFPTALALAAAPVEDVLRLWAGLGYYARARNLHRAAQVVVERHGGLVPAELAKLASLPGVGRYTAGAIRSIGHGLPAPIVDANIARVLARLFALDGDPKSGPVQRRLWDAASALTELAPDGSVSDFNQALMELGALVCTPADPACERCPLLSFCLAGNSDDPTRWPQLPAGRATVRETHACAVIRRDDMDAVLLTRRPLHGLWGGLWELPRRVCGPGESPADCAMRAAREVVSLDAAAGRRLATVKHMVTFHAITLHAFEARVGAAVAGDACPADCAEVLWLQPEELTKLPLSAPQARVVEQVFGPMAGKLGEYVDAAAPVIPNAERGTSAAEESGNSDLRRRMLRLPSE